jgi:mannose-1-phosphate guanylyltransferase
VYAVIMAGGGGTRLWPLSSPERPKPFLPLLGDRTLLQLSADRLEGLVDPSSIYVVTDRRYVGYVAAQLPAATILAEPEGRNTAAAIAYASVAIDRPDDEVMLVLPADQTVEKPDVFKGVLRDAERELAMGAFGIEAPLVTLGVQPTRPATEYGYLLPDRDRAQHGGLEAYVLKEFIEKPNLARATELFEATAGVAWNAGMFMWQRQAIMAALGQHATDIHDGVHRGHRSGSLAEAYPELRSISIDYAVMEPAAAAGQVVMGSMDVGWNDLGSWTSLLGELGMPGIAATIARPGEAFETGPDDLVVWRSGDGRLRSAADPQAGREAGQKAGSATGPDATMARSNGPVAILRDARSVQARIDALLDRCSSPEAHP